MSEMTPSASSEDKHDEQVKRPVVLTVMVLLVLTGLVAVIALVARSSPEAAKESDEEGSEGELHEEPLYDSVAVDTLLPSTSTPPTTTTTTLKTTTARHRPRVLMLCAMGTFQIRPTLMPPDGLCDMIFYTHVFFEDAWHGLGDDDSWDVFQAGAGDYNKTLFGVSVDATHANSTNAGLEQPSGKQHFKHLWDKGIHHHGILNLYGIDADIEGFEHDALPLLKTLNSLQAEIRPGHIVLGVRMLDYRKKGALRNFITALPDLVTRHNVSMLVIGTHVDVWNRQNNCTAGGTLRSSISGCSLTVPNLYDTVKEIKRTNLGTQVDLLLSFTCNAAQFQMSSRWNNTDGIDSTPHAYSAVAYARSCRRGGLLFHRKGELSWRSYKGGSYQVVFDTPSYMADKVRATALSLNSTNTGWAIFDVEHEDTKDLCNNTATNIRFPTLNAVRSAIENLNA